MCIEKVNPCHPDKVADRIAGAIVDYCYTQQEDPKVAVEVLIGHGICTVIAESSVSITEDVVAPITKRIAGPDIELKLVSVPQDAHLAENQKDEIRCGDNGIFVGLPMDDEEIELSDLANTIYEMSPYDGKYILDKENNRLIVCQSHIESEPLRKWLEYKYKGMDIIVNPLGEWFGGTDVDSGATNRKLGSDMGHSVTGGGLHGKDCSKADVSVNIYAWLMAQKTGEKQVLSCAIGDTVVGGVPYKEIVETAKEYIDMIGGYEAFAAWGLV